MNQTENTMVRSMRAGFTLIEILVAVAIIGILGSVAIVNVIDNIESARQTAAKEACGNFENAALTYSMKHGKLPKELKDLVVAKGDELPAMKGGKGALKDPWGNEYKYEKKGKAYSVTSAGPDGQFGTDDDIGSDTKDSED